MYFTIKTKQFTTFSRSSLYYFLLGSLALLSISNAQPIPLKDNSTNDMKSGLIQCNDKKNNIDCKKALPSPPPPLSNIYNISQRRTSDSAITFSTVNTSTPSFTRQNLVMYSGEAVVIEVGELDRVAIGSGKIATTTVLDKNRLLIISQDVGDTNILLWDKLQLVREIKLRVTAQNLSRIVTEARNLLESVQGLEINNVGDRIFIEGKNLSEQELGKVKALAAEYPGIIDRTSGRYQESRSADPSAMVMFDLYFVEFKKSYLQNLGVNWQKSFNGLNIGFYGESSRGDILLRPNIGDLLLPEKPVNGLSVGANVIATLPGVINLAVDSGDAILLAAPKIASRSGGKARFNAGGEVPLPSTSSEGTGVTFKSYGILLEVEPQISADGSISGLVRAEVSSIDPAVSVLGIPGFLTRRTEADFFSRSGEAVVLSGLYSQDLSKTIDKIPLLGDIPLLGSLFSNSLEVRRNSELVIFIVPHLYGVESEINKKILKNTRDIVEEKNKLLNGDGTDVLLKLKITSQLWADDVLGNAKLGRDSKQTPLLPALPEDSKTQK